MKKNWVSVESFIEVLNKNQLLNVIGGYSEFSDWYCNGKRIYDCLIYYSDDIFGDMDEVSVCADCACEAELIVTRKYCNAHRINCF